MAVESDSSPVAALAQASVGGVSLQGEARKCPQDLGCGRPCFFFLAKSRITPCQVHVQSDKVWIEGDTTFRDFDTSNAVSGEPVRIGKPFEIIRRMKWIETDGPLDHFYCFLATVRVTEHGTEISKCDGVIWPKGKSRIGFSAGCIELAAKLMHLRQQYMRCGV